MSAGRLLQDVEQLAKALLEIDDATDLKDIGRIYNYFQKFRGAAADSGFDKIATATQKAADMLRGCMLDETVNRHDIYKKLSEIVSAIQHMLLNGRYDVDIIKEETTPEGNQGNQKGSKKGFNLPAYLDQQIFVEFLNEKDSVLEKIESHLLRLEKGIDKETLGDLRRIFHTLKGESSIFELYDVQKLCHMTEDLIDRSSDNLPIDTLLQIKDWLKDVFDALKMRADLPEIEDKLINLLTIPGTAEGMTEVKLDLQPDIKGQHDKVTATSPKTDAPYAFPNADIDLLTDFIGEAQEHIENIDSKLLLLENNPEDDDLLNAVFRVFHTIKGAAGFLALDEMARLAHSTENLLDAARKGELVLSDRRIDIVFESLDAMKKIVANIKSTIEAGGKCYAQEVPIDQLIEKIANITSAYIQHEDQQADTVAVQVEGVASLHQESPEEQPSRYSEEYTAAAIEQAVTAATLQQQIRIKEAIKVDSENLDKLIDAIGELVIIESMIKQDPEMSKLTSSKLLRNMAHMNKITRELQQIGMSLRMIPVKATFQKMARVVRDLGKKNNKRIEFITSGEDTMLDKSVVDRIGDPLIHLVRNCVDHGIEQNAGERKLKNKPESGRIELHAFHKGGNIYLEISDDGNGLNKQAIVKKAIEKGLARDVQTFSDSEIFNFIFLPGFSTAQKVTDVSGRGVGMDVVRRTIAELRGNIEIISEEDKGTVFSIRLPLTLAIIDGMLVLTGSERFIIPTLSIVKAIKPRSEDISTITNRGEMIRIRDDLIPMYRLADLFGIKGAKRDAAEGIVIVVEDSGKMAGVLVDELLGQQSTVIKSLGASLKGLIGISGSSIMSDGKVGIIVDVGGIIRLATAGSESLAQRHNGIYKYHHSKVY